MVGRVTLKSTAIWASAASLVVYVEFVVHRFGQFDLTWPKPGFLAPTIAGPCGCQPLSSPFRSRRGFELGNGAEDMEEHQILLRSQP